MNNTFIEALNVAQRQKLKRSFKKTKKKREIATKRNRKKLSSPEKIDKKANKAARKIIEKKILSGKEKSDLSFSARQALEKKVDKKKGAIQRIAKKEKKNVKKKDRERVQKARAA